MGAMNNLTKWLAQSAIYSCHSSECAHTVKIQSQSHTILSS